MSLEFVFCYPRPQSTVPLLARQCGGFCCSHPWLRRFAFLHACLRGEVSSPVHLSLMHWRHLLVECGVPVHGVHSDVAAPPGSAWGTSSRGTVRHVADAGGGGGSGGGGGVSRRGPRRTLQMAEVDVIFAKHTEVRPLRERMYLVLPRG